jgi:hypothetical protein
VIRVLGSCQPLAWVPVTRCEAAQHWLMSCLWLMLALRKQRFVVGIGEYVLWFKPIKPNLNNWQSSYGAPQERLGSHQFANEAHASDRDHQKHYQKYGRTVLTDRCLVNGSGLCGQIKGNTLLVINEYLVIWLRVYQSC